MIVKFNRVLICILAATCLSLEAQAQMGGGIAQGGMGGFAGGATTSGSFERRPPVVIAKPDSQTAQAARNSLDRILQLGAVNTRLGNLGVWMTKVLDDVPVFLDRRGIELARLNGDTLIEAKLPKMPLRSALRKLLRPHSLRVIVEEEGLVITADFAELTRRGIATDTWVGRDEEAYVRIQKSLDQRVTVDLRDVELGEAIRRLAEAAGIPIALDRRALDDAGIPVNKQIGLRIKNAKLTKVLQLILREEELTYLLHDEVLQITTKDAANELLCNRIYFLEGTGFAVGDSTSVSNLIQASVTPDAWDILGGSSTISVVSHGHRARPAILVSTTVAVHEKIEALFLAMRETHVGSDPIVGPGEGPAIRLPPAQPLPVVGGLF